MMPPFVTASRRLASVHDAGEPSPTFVVGVLVSTSFAGIAHVVVVGTGGTGTLAADPSGLSTLPGPPSPLVGGPPLLEDAPPLAASSEPQATRTKKIESAQRAGARAAAMGINR
jgi:hypothetical protein